MRLLLMITALCILALLPQQASAQCTYKMNDVGRPHGYLSGPCNGSTVNYAGAYPARTAQTQRSIVTYDRAGNLNGSTSVHSNAASAYDRNGRLLGTAVKRNDNSVVWTKPDGSRSIVKVVRRGNTTHILNGPHAGRVVHNGDGTTTHYDKHGKYIGSGRQN
jgi:hypothetical protein